MIRLHVLDFLCWSTLSAVMKRYNTVLGPGELLEACSFFFVCIYHSPREFLCFYSALKRQQLLQQHGVKSPKIGRIQIIGYRDGKKMH